MAPWNRRQWLQASGLGLIGSSLSGWLPLLANDLAPDKKRRRHCVLLWMTGGPSQTDTFDMKPGHANGGPIQEIETNVPGVRFSEHLPKLAKQADRLAIVRGLSTKEGDHGRGTYLMRTGHQPQGPVRYPSIGASLSKALSAGDESIEVPNFVAISPFRAFNQAAFGPGFLGPRHAPLTVGATDIPTAAPTTGTYAELKVDDLEPPAGVSREQFAARLGLWGKFQDDFLAKRRAAAAVAHDTVYRRALKLMDSNLAQAFDLSQEPAAVREAYGTGRFGQGCLLARRLIERGVPFIEVTLGSVNGGAFGWDTHQDNFKSVQALSTELDNGWATLMNELAERGLLESTTILWLGEFGRTPRINPQQGRDHFPAAWTCAFAGGGIKTGQAFGRTSESGESVEDGKVDAGDVLTTLCTALGVPPGTENISDVGRPIKLAEGKPIEAILTGSMV